MTNKENIVNQFHDTVELIMQATTPMAEGLAEAAESIVTALLEDSKVLCFGEAQAALTSQLFSSQMLSNFNYERPSLPVVNLSANTNALSVLASSFHQNDIFARQITALGKENDLLLTFINPNFSSATIQAIQAAHDKNIRIIAIVDATSNDPSALLLPNDIEIRIPTTQIKQLTALQVITVNSLCTLIDKLIFGIEEYLDD